MEDALPHEPRRRRGGFALWWAAALCLHLAWVPNLIDLLRLPEEPSSPQYVEVTTVSMPATGQRERLGGDDRPRLARATPDQPGSAPSGRPSTEAVPWLEYVRQIPFERVESSASRSLRSAAEYQAASPRRAGAEASPTGGAATPAPGMRDIAAPGRPDPMDSYAQRRGARGQARATEPSSAAGSPSRGRRLHLGPGEHGVESDAAGSMDAEAALRRGAEPVRARPAITAGPEAADAPRVGPIGGTIPRRQASPRVALAPSVRESRRASARYGADDHGASRAHVGSVAGAGRQRRGPAAGGRGESEQGPGTAREPLYDDYFRSVVSRIGSHWGPYPRTLAYDLQQGLVVLQVSVRHDGRVERVTVHRSSGHEEFDAVAVQAVRHADPLGPPPPELLFVRGSNSIVLNVPMRYRNPMFE